MTPTPDFDTWIARCEADMALMIERCQRYYTALEFYANGEHYAPGDRDETFFVCTDHGEFARRALDDC